jgi:hypothetical protein
MTLLFIVTYENKIDLEHNVATNVTVIILFYPHRSDKTSRAA